MIHTVFLDMDGVLFNFVDHALKIHGTSAAALDAKWPRGRYDVHEAMGITEDEFWAKIDQRFAFWDSLPRYDWADSLYDAAKTVAPVMILTAPSMNPQSPSGKVASLQRWKGRHFRDFILAPAKHKRHLARPGAVLVDDSDRNCEDWAKDGGFPILFPQRWNANHELAKDPIAAFGFVVRELVLLRENAK